MHVVYELIDQYRFRERDIDHLHRESDIAAGGGHPVGQGALDHLDDGRGRYRGTWVHKLHLGSGTGGNG